MSVVQRKTLIQHMQQIAGGAALLLLLCAHPGGKDAATSSATSLASASATTPILAAATAPEPQMTTMLSITTITVTPTVQPGPCDPPVDGQPVSPAEIDIGNTSKPQIALTFDAGGDEAPGPILLSILQRRSVPATWFFIGNWAEQNPEIVRGVVAAGYEIGNHSLTHPDLTKLADSAVCSELTRAEQTISHIAGQTTRPYFRPPFGARNQQVRHLAAQLGYRTVYWTIDTLDWQPSSTPASILQRISGRLKNGAIILMHAGSTSEVQALDQAITMIQQQGYQLVTLSQILS